MKYNVEDTVSNKNVLVLNSQYKGSNISQAQKEHSIHQAQCETQHKLAATETYLRAGQTRTLYAQIPS